MVNTDKVDEFLAGRRFAVVGASDDRANFGGTVYRALRDHGYEVVAVNPTAATVGGDVCYPDLASVPGSLDGVVVMVGAPASAGVVRACAEFGIPRVWLFQGIGGTGAVCPDAVQQCQDHGIEVIAGACPLMFLEPVGWFHRLHRAARRRNGSLSPV